MNMWKRMGMNPWRMLWGVLIAGVIGISGAKAQTWYGFYGDHVDFDERGFKRVIPVLNQGCRVTDEITEPCEDCMVTAQGVQTNGYLAVGFSDMQCQTGNNRDVYVVRVKNDGSTAWEKTYDIGNNGLDDVAWSVVELAPNPNGDCFAIVGTAEIQRAVGAIDTDIFVLVIDNNGNVVSTNTYDNNNRNDEGRDIIQAQHIFNPPAPTVPGFQIPPQAGDLVFCGFTDNTTAAGNFDGVIIRTNVAGVQAWNVQHDLSTAPSPRDDRFVSLTESLNHPNPANHGEILVAGSHENVFAPINRQALVGRVLGTNGLVGALPTGFCSYGGGNTDEFNAVIELTNGAFGPPGDLAVVGSTNSPTGGGNYDVYVRHFVNGNPCAPGGDVWIDGDMNPGVTVNDMGLDIREVVNPGLFAPPGHLLVTGFTDFNGGDDVLLVEIMPGPVPAPMWRLYGDFGTENDQGVSLADVAALNGRTRGVIMCGWTNGAYKSNHCNVLPNNNTDDLFLVKTDQNGSVRDNSTGTSCVEEWEIEWAHPGYPQTTLNSVTARPYRTTPWETPRWCWDTDKRCCYTAASQINPDGEATPDTDGVEFSESMIRNSVAPVKEGEMFTLDLAPRAKSAISVTVVDADGREVFRRTLPEFEGARNLALSTAGWPSGSYLLKATDGKRIDAMQVNVLD